MNNKQYCMNQVELANIHKWCESQKAGHDLGEEAIVDWVNHNAAAYREEYDKVFHNMVSTVVADVKNTHQCACLTEEAIFGIVKIVIEKFTDTWTIETAKDNHNQHIDEL